MRTSVRLAVGLFLFSSAGCGHFLNTARDANRVVQVWPGPTFHGIAVLALLGDDVRLFNRQIINLPASSPSEITVQFAIANAFRQDILFRGSTRTNTSRRSVPAISCVVEDPPNDRNSGYTHLLGLGQTGVRFQSRGMTWTVGGENVTIPERGSIQFRRVFLLDFHVVGEGMHYVVDFPIECTFRR